jgi:DNA-binding MarR family transcriptional regulator
MLIQTDPELGILQVLILRTIERHPGITMPEIERRLRSVVCVFQGSLYTALKSLAARDLIVPGRPKQRAIPYSMSSQGLDALDSMRRHHIAVLQYLV